MSLEAIIILGLLAWLIVSAAVHKHAYRAGSTFGYYPGAGWLCRFLVIVQAPAVWLDYLWLTNYRALRNGEDWEPIVVPRMFWEMLKEPALSPDGAFNLLDERDGRL
jgi:hypothetical protein